jgi:hypothetical protein
MDESQPLHPLQQAEVEPGMSGDDGRELGAMIGFEILSSHAGVGPKHPQPSSADASPGLCDIKGAGG